MDCPQSLTNPGSLFRRRTFIAKSVTGLAAAVGSTGLCSAFTGVPQVPSYGACKPSVADSLVLYIDLLLKVQSEAFLAASDEIVAASRLCSMTLREIQDQVKVLQKEIENASSSAQVQRLNEIVRTGTVQADILNASLVVPYPINNAVVASMKVVGFDLSIAAQDLLPPGEIKLTPKAKAALEKLLKLVKEYETIPEETLKAQQRYQNKVSKIQNCVEGIRDSLFEASELVVDSERATSSIEVEQGRTGALKLIDDVKKRLEALKKNCCDVAVLDPSVQCIQRRPSPATDLLITVLEGTKLWIQKPSLITMFHARREAMIAPARFEETAPINLYQSVWNAIEKHCPRATHYKTAWCIGLILGPLAFQEKVKRVSLIAGVLVLYPCWRGNKDTLCGELADLGV